MELTNDRILTRLMDNRGDMEKTVDACIKFLAPSFKRPSEWKAHWSTRLLMRRAINLAKKEARGRTGRGMSPTANYLKSKGWI
jgi:hypothetical protein